MRLAALTWLGDRISQALLCLVPPGDDKAGWRGGPKILQGAA